MTDPDPDTQPPGQPQPALRHLLSVVTFSVNAALAHIVRNPQPVQPVTLTVAMDDVGPLSLSARLECYADHVLFPRRLDLAFQRSGVAADLLQAPPWWLVQVRLVGQLMHRDLAEPEPDTEEVDRIYLPLPDASNLPTWLYGALVGPALVWQTPGMGGPPTRAQAREVDRAAALPDVRALPVAGGRGGVVTVPADALVAPEHPGDRDG